VLRKHTADPPPEEAEPEPEPEPITAPPPPPSFVAVTPGSFKGATSVGNYVFFDVTVDRYVTGFRVNDFRMTCDGPLVLGGGLPSDALPKMLIKSDGSFVYDNTGEVRDEQGNPVKVVLRVTGLIQGGIASGTAFWSNELTYEGRYYHCATEQQTWTAARLP
jgi:hypothetical protein